MADRRVSNRDGNNSSNKPSFNERRGRGSQLDSSASTLDQRADDDDTTVTEDDSRYLTAKDVIGSSFIGDADSDEEEEEDIMVKAKLEEDICKEELSIAQRWLTLPRHFSLKMPKTYLKPHHDKKVMPKHAVIQMLLGKNFKLFWHQPWYSVLEILIPVLAVTIFTIYVSTLPAVQTEPKVYERFSSEEVSDSTFNSCQNFIYISTNSIVDEIMPRMEDHMRRTISKNKFYWHKEPSFAKFQKKRYQLVCAVIVFQGPSWNVPDGILPQDIHYEIRMPAAHVQDSNGEEFFLFFQDIWHTKDIYPTMLKTVGRNKNDKHGGEPGYFSQGFLFLEAALNEAIHYQIYKICQETCKKSIPSSSSISLVTYNIINQDFSDHTAQIESFLQRFSVPGHLTSVKLELVHEELSFIIAGTFICPLMFFLRQLLGEKENGLRVQLSAHGISLTLQNLAWLVRGLIVHSVMAMMITFITAISWTTDGVPVLGSTDPFIFFIFLAAMIWNGLCFACTLGSAFHRVTTGMFVMLITGMTILAPFFYVTSIYKKISFGMKFALGASEHLGAIIGFNLISESEIDNTGLGWSDLFHERDYTLGWNIVSQILFGFLYLVLAMYTENIFCEEGQLVYPFTYLKEKWFWRGEMPPDKAEPEQNINRFEDKNPEFFEDDSKKRRRKELEIVNICKKFGDIKVLRNINLTCYYGHINLVIGGTSEGKTTLINIVNGMCPATAGHIVISSIHMNKERKQAQSYIGLCPQKTALYPNLTVEETLVLYARLKGMLNTLETMEEVERMMSNAYLTDFRKCRVSELTITSQRLLMVATAFCGGSRVVLLDEPTEGMDACQKRLLWEFIKKEKHHRTILATGEGMNEGDTCVDKVAILCRGQIQCMGTPKFILARLGGGYFLTLKKTPKYNDVNVKAAMEEIIPGTQFTETEDSICFNIESDETSRFPILFDELELDQFLGVGDVQLSFVSLEEVQNKMNMQNSEPEDPEVNSEREKTFRTASTFDVIPSIEMTKLGLMCYQFRYLLMKNAKFHFRRRGQFWIATLIPLLTVIISCTLLAVLQPFDHSPVRLPLDLSQSAYGSPILYLDCDRVVPNSGRFLCGHISTYLKHKFPHVELQLVKDISAAMAEGINHDSSEIQFRRKIPLFGIAIHGKKGFVQTCDLTGYYNNYGYHTLPILQAIIDNLRIAYSVDKYWEICSDYAKFKNYTVTVVNNPLPSERWDKIAKSEGISSDGFVIILTLIVGLCVFLATMSIMYVVERKFKHLQLMCGVSLLLFWISNYLWNFLHYSFELIVIVAILILFRIKIPDFNILNIVENVAILLIIGGICIILMIGVFGNFKHANPGLALSRTLMFLIATGPGLLIAITVWQQSTWYKKDKGPLTVCHYSFLIFPSYAITAGFLYIYINSVHKSECAELESYFDETCSKPKRYLMHGTEYHESCCQHYNRNPWGWSGYGAGWNLTVLVVEAVFCILIKMYQESDWSRLLVIRYHAWRMRNRKIVPTHHTDLQDLVVLDETAAALGMTEEDSKFGLCLRNLCKEYPFNIPVNSLNMFLMNGEVFGLLGEHHSDKDDLVDLLTGNTEPSSGDIFFNNLTLMKDYRKYVAQIGYSSYHSQFLEELTGKETILLLGSLKGTSPETMEGIVSNLALKLFILHDLHNLIAKYSPSTLLKFSAACAMLGDPRLCIFDEPSIGIDSESRFYLWSCIQSLAKGGCTVIVSSHNMEECEQFCTKIGIYINGKLRCLGTVPELKARHTNGYAVVVRFCPTFSERHFTTAEDNHKRAKFAVEAHANNDRHLQENIRIDDYQTSRIKMGMPADEPQDFESDIDVQSFLDYRQMIAHELGSKSTTEQISKTISPEDLSHWESDLLPFMRYFERRVHCTLLDIQPNFLFYQIDRNVCKWSDIFNTMEEAKLLEWTCPIESYYVGETSLEQMFLNYSRGQQPRGETTL